MSDDDIVSKFLDHTKEEDGKLAGALGRLDEAGRTQLAGLLGRFDSGKNGTLGAGERLHARRVLLKLRHPDHTDVLVETNRVLDYLDLNADATLSADELSLTIEVLEQFAQIESANDTLTLRELQLLYAVLRHLDADDSRRLEKNERVRLREA
ncbi:MAG: hypothetical protein AAGA56_23240, partial [Myxococcota bacterium]